MLRLPVLREGSPCGLRVTTRGALQSPIGQSWWTRQRDYGKDPKFVAVVDDIVAGIRSETATRTVDEAGQAQ